MYSLLISPLFSGMKDAPQGLFNLCVIEWALSTTFGGLFEYNEVSGPLRNAQHSKSMSKADEPRVNRQISAASIRLIDQNGDMIGVVPAGEGMKLAEQAGLDLVEISPGASPPVCKILDYGKYRYEAQKKAHEARKKQKVIQIKEIKLRPTIGEHDLGIKLRNTMGFLEEGDKVRITLRFRGREMDHQDLGMQVLARVQEALKDQCKIESPPRKEGKQIVMMVAPR